MLTKVPNEAVKFNALASEEEVLSFPFRYIDFVKFTQRFVRRLDIKAVKKTVASYG